MLRGSSKHDQHLACWSSFTCPGGSSSHLKQPLTMPFLQECKQLAKDMKQLPKAVSCRPC